MMLYLMLSVKICGTWWWHLKLLSTELTVVRIQSSVSSEGLPSL